MRETVLLINFKDEKRLRAVRSVLMLHKVLIKTVAKEEYAQPAGALAGIKELEIKDAVYTGDDLEKEMILFAGLSDAKLNSILAGMRKKKITGISLKAVLTPSNMHWTIPKLYDEISKEHEYMKKEKKPIHSADL